MIKSDSDYLVCHQLFLFAIQALKLQFFKSFSKQIMLPFLHAEPTFAFCIPCTKLMQFLCNLC